MPDRLKGPTTFIGSRGVVSLARHLFPEVSVPSLLSETERGLAGTQNRLWQLYGLFWVLFTGVLTFYTVEKTAECGCENILFGLWDQEDCDYWVSVWDLFEEVACCSLIYSLITVSCSLSPFTKPCSILSDFTFLPFLIKFPPSSFSVAFPAASFPDLPSVLFPVNLFYLRFSCLTVTACIIEEAKVNKESPRQSPSPVPFALSFRIWIPFTFLLLPLGELISACGRICGRQGLRNSPAENKSLFVHFSFPFADSTVNSFTHQSLEVLHKLLQFCETTLDINKLQITQNFEDHINPKPQLRKTENPSSKGQRFQTFAQDVGTKYDY